MGGSLPLSAYHEYKDDRRSERVKEPRRFQSTVIACLNLREDASNTPRQGLSAREIAEALEVFDQTDKACDVLLTLFSTNVLTHV